MYLTNKRTLRQVSLINRNLWQFLVVIRNSDWVMQSVMKNATLEKKELLGQVKFNTFILSRVTH